MPGSGINENNIAQIARETGATEFHLSARNPVSSSMQYRNPNVSMGGKGIEINEYEQNITDAEKVRKTLTQLKNK